MKNLTNNLNFAKVLQDMNKTIHRREDEFLSKFNLSHFHAKYIANLYVHKQLSMSELTEIIRVDKANTTRAVKDLIDKGFVEKVGEGERKFNLQLSEKGLLVAKQFKAQIDKFFKKVLEDFTGQERETLCVLLKKLFEGVKNARNF